MKTNKRRGGRHHVNFIIIILWMFNEFLVWKWNGGKTRSPEEEEEGECTMNSQLAFLLWLFNQCACAHTSYLAKIQKEKHPWVTDCNVDNSAVGISEWSHHEHLFYMESISRTGTRWHNSGDVVKHCRRLFLAFVCVFLFWGDSVKCQRLVFQEAQPVAITNKPNLD